MSKQIINGVVNYYLLLPLSILMLLVSCSRDGDINENNEILNDGDQITFSAGQISTRVNGNQFELSDVINVEAYTTSGELYGKKVYSYDISSIFTSSDPFVMDGQTALSYTALYPSNATSDNFADDFIFNIETNQSIYANYEQSDMLVSKVGATSLLQPELSFYHTMSIISVSVVGASSLDDISTKVYAQTAATCNIEDETYQGKGENSAITPYITSSGFEAIVAPQQLSAGIIGVMEVGDYEYIWSNNNSSTLLSGYRYNYIWSINEVTGESTVIFDGIINDWADGDWSDDNDPDDQADPADYVIDSTTFGTSGENLSGTFEINGFTFEYSGIDIFEENDSTYIEITPSGYIINTKALPDLYMIIFESDDQSEITENLAVSGCASGLETAYVSLTYSTVDGLSAVNYYIPANTVYLKLSTNASASVKLQKIEFVFKE